jgi:hypothetical protein
VGDTEESDVRTAGIRPVVTRHEQVARASHPAVTIGSGANGPGSGEQLLAAVRGMHIPLFNTRMVQFANDSSAPFPRRRVITTVRGLAPASSRRSF